jgi:hypothetical protein
MPIGAGAIIGAGASIIGGLFGSSSAKRAAREAAAAKARLAKRLHHLETHRGKIVNPYEGVESVAGFSKDMSSEISNPFANLGVATQAAEIQMEESDLALAASLDTMRATGAGAGGATALANAALRSKKGVAANIEQQEKSNEEKRAEGERQMQEAKMAEKIRIQGIQMSEAARVQAAQAAGKQFQFSAKEAREEGRISRTLSQLTGAAQATAQARADQTGAITGMFGSLASIGGSLIGGGN